MSKTYDITDRHLVCFQEQDVVAHPDLPFHLSNCLSACGPMDTATTLDHLRRAILVHVTRLRRDAWRMFMAGMLLIAAFVGLFAWIYPEEAMSLLKRPAPAPEQTSHAPSAVAPQPVEKPADGDRLPVDRFTLDQRVIDSSVSSIVPFVRAVSWTVFAVLILSGLYALMRAFLGFHRSREYGRISGILSGEARTPFQQAMLAEQLVACGVISLHT